MTAGFSPASVTAGGSSTLTLTVGATVTPGTYPLTVTGTAASATHTTGVSLTVTAPVTNDFSISASPSERLGRPGHRGRQHHQHDPRLGQRRERRALALGPAGGGDRGLQPGQRHGRRKLHPDPHRRRDRGPGTYPLTVTGTAASATHTTGVSLTVTAPVTNDFSIAAKPTSLSVVQGTSGGSTISTTLVSGSAESVALSLSGRRRG